MAEDADEIGSAANRYQILAKLAAGGMAEIFLARAAGVAGVERHCVLKRVRRERADDARMIQMFIDEARLAAQLQHPNIASVYDVGTLGDSLFFTMEYVHGETVRSLFQRTRELGQTVPLACVLTIIAGAAAGLHHAHERYSSDGTPLGIVHRDVSPSNLMVSFEGHVKLVDFGVAKATDRVSETRAGTVKGKISYLSPEQCRGNPLDRRSDLFSLGIVMWELLTGTRLYRRATDFENMVAIVEEPAPLPSSLRPDIPPVVNGIVARLLAKSVDDRFQTAADLIEAIEQAAISAGMILSATAVSRLIRELFGTRPEPWLAIDTGSPRLSQLMLTAFPSEADVGAMPLVDVDAELAAGLAGVPDLTTGGYRALLDPLSESMGSAAGQPLALPDPQAQPLLDSASRSDLPIAPYRQPPARPQPTVPPTRKHSGRSSRHSSQPSSFWPAVVAVAGLASVAVALWLTLRGDGRPAATAGSSTIVAASPVVASAADREATAPSATPGQSPTTTAPSATTGTQPNQSSGQTNPPVPSQPIQPSGQTSPPVPSQPTQPSGQTSPPVSSQPIQEAGASPTSKSSRTVPAKPSTSNGRAQPNTKSTSDDPVILYADGEYRRAVQACSAKITTDIARICVLAACQTRNATKARQWRTSVRASERDQLTAKCKDASNGSVNLAPTLDCSRDPLDCR